LRNSSDRGCVAQSLILARKAVELGKQRRSSPSFQMTLGMCEFRMGHSTEADAALLAAINNGKDNLPLWTTSAFFRSMNLFRQGKSDEARRVATEAASKMTPLPKDQTTPLRHSELIPWMAYKEARELLKLDSISTASGPSGK
jgi:hypothetical protein